MKSVLLHAIRFLLVGNVCKQIILIERIVKKYAELKVAVEVLPISLEVVCPIDYNKQKNSNSIRR